MAAVGLHSGVSQIFNSAKIVNAYGSNMDWKKVREAVHNIGVKAFGKPANWIADPQSHVTSELLQGVPAVSEMCKSQTFLLAMQAEVIVGFAITAEGSPVNSMSSSSLVYFAVDGDLVSSKDDVRKLLMLETMRVTQQLGSHCLSITCYHNESVYGSWTNIEESFFSTFMNEHISIKTKDIPAIPARGFEGGYETTFELDGRFDQMLSRFTPGDKIQE